MEISVQLLAGLQKHSPTGEPGFTLQIAEGATVAAVFDELGITHQGKDMKVVLVNGRQAQWQQKLHESDLLVVFPPIEGG